MRGWRRCRSTGAIPDGPRLATLAAASKAVLFKVSLIGLVLAGATDCTIAQGTRQPVAMPLLPSSVAFDAAGNLYFADTNRQVVYESSLAGVLSVVAGDGVQGFDGDGSSATSAQLNSPQGVAVGQDGSLYIADTGNERVRLVTGGIISTFAGNGTAGFGGDGGMATSAAFLGMNALAIDASGALLVCDAGNQRIRRISAGLVETVVGNGIQGFAGDGASAGSAELNTPMGLAVGSDGRIFVADSHNQRIRIISIDGNISTIAGNGIAGYAGDGGASVAAEVSLPRGLIVTPAGAVLFADSNNQRIRMVDANGTITTVAGSGVQGAASDGTPDLGTPIDSPRAVALSLFGTPVYADTLSHLVRESVANGNVYVPAGLAPTRTSTMTLTTSSDGAETEATVSVAGPTGTPQGIVELLDATSILTQKALVEGTAIFTAQNLSVGTHLLSAAYLGDGVNPAATSAAIVVNSGTGVITATANSVNIHYGQPVPLLGGSLTGEPAQGVLATFTSSATTLSPVGNYPIAVTLSGPQSAYYAVVMSSTSGNLQITQAASISTEQPVNQNSYAGLPLLLIASVGSTTTGTPTGLVTFLDNGVVVASASLSAGTATGTYLSPTAGMHSLVASYAGNSNFLACLSPSVTTIVALMPDFSIATAGSTTQVVAPGDVANYSITVAPQSGAFTGVVNFSVSGLPTGATASFSPPQLVPGANSVPVTLNVQTSAALLARAKVNLGSVMLVGLAFPLWMVGMRRQRAPRWFTICSLLVLVQVNAGCGARSLSTTLEGGKTYTLTIVGTSTNLAGTVVSHSTLVTLVVE